MNKLLRTQIAVFRITKARLVIANRTGVKEHKAFWFGQFNKARNALVRAIRDTETALGKPHRYLLGAGKNQWGGK